MKVSKNKVMAGLAAAAIGLMLVWAFRPQPVVVETGWVETGSLEVTVNEDGRTRIRERYVVSAPLAGKLDRISLHPGDPVEEGKTLIARIQPTDPQLLDPSAKAQAEARVNGAEAAKKQAQAQVDRSELESRYATTEMERRKGLLAHKVSTQEEYDAAEQRALTSAKDLRAAEFALQVAEFEYEQARAVLVRSGTGAAGEGSHEILAPVSGRVLRVIEESATIAQPGLKLLEIGDPTDLEIEVDVLSRDAIAIRPGARVIIEHWGGDAVLLGRVRIVEPSAFTKVSALGVEEQRVNVIVDFTSPVEERIALGDAFRVEVRIVTWSGEAVRLVPVGALFRHEGKWAVFAAEDGHARLTTVGIGHANDRVAEVLSGLEEGESVILYPSDKVRDGVSIVSRSGL